MKNVGIPLRRGQLVEVKHTDLEGVFRVERDVEWNAPMGVWGSVSLVGQYPPRFTNKGGIRVISPGLFNMQGSQ